VGVTEPDPGPARREWARRLALAAAATAFALVTAEVALRALDYQHDVLALFEPRDGDGFRLQPDLDITTRVRGRAAHLTTNSRGLPWREVEDDGRPRVAVLGDSFAFGLWASEQSAAFPAVFERGIDPRRYQVINFGVPGYGYTDMAIALTEDVLPRSPTWVVLVSYNGNDYLDTWLGPNRYRVTANGALEQDREAIADALPAEIVRATPVPGGRLVDRSPLLRMTRAVARRVLPSREPDADPGTGWTSDLIWSAAHYPEYAAEARDVALAELARIDDLVRAGGSQLVLVALPYAQQVEQPGLFGDEYDIDLPQRDIAALAQVRGLPFLDLRPGLAGHGDLYVQGEGHLTDAGHDRVGQLLAEFFLSEVAPPE